MARWYDSTITLLHVYAIVPVAAYAPGTPMHPPVVLTPEDRDAVLASMERFAEGQAGSDLRMQLEVREGNIAGEILARADELPADLLVLGTHGRSGFERLVLGSVAEKVLRKAACPVLSVPQHAGDAGAAPPVLFKRILCATDFSNCSTNALNHAMSLAQEADVQLTVVHVLEPALQWPEDLQEMPGGPQRIEEYRAAAEADRRARLDAAVPDSVQTYCTVDNVLAAGTPYREILRIASEQQSDLIVIGIHGRGAADLMFFGSTTQHIVRQAICPVLTLRRA